MTTPVSNDQNFGSKRELVGWKLAEVGWSGYEVTILAAVLGPYLLSLIDDNGGSVSFGLFSIGQASYFAYLVGLSSLLQVVLLPIVGAIGDFSPYRKWAVLGPAYVASVATFGLFFLTASTIMVGSVLFLISAVGFNAAQVSYNAYLPLLASPEDRDRVSSSGASWGYLGSFVYLLSNIALFAFLADNLGLAARISLGGVGLWALAFLYFGPQRMLLPRPAQQRKPDDTGWFRLGFGQVWKLLGELRRMYPQAWRYLITYLIFIDAVSAIIALATTFASEVLEVDGSTLLLIILMIQLLASPGAIFFGWLAGRLTARSALAINLSVWAAITVSAYLLVDTVTEFWVLGAAVAIVLGGSRALSRSLFSQMIPPAQEARYFGLYQISASGSSWAAPIIFALVSQVTGSIRLAILPLTLFFVISVVLLLQIDVDAGIEDARRQR